MMYIGNFFSIGVVYGYDKRVFASLGNSDSVFLKEFGISILCTSTLNLNSRIISRISVFQLSYILFESDYFKFVYQI